MSKGEQTREVIVQRAAQVFNRQGYFGASLTDIMRATGLEKGGIYNHFASKEELALEAFDYAFGLVDRRIKTAVAAHTNAVDRLRAIIETFVGLAEDPPLPGGCPVLNTVIEADDNQPALRDKAKAALDTLFNTIRHLITRGQARGEIRPECLAEETGSLMISALEGALMLSTLYNNPDHMKRVAAHLTGYLETTLRA